MRKSKIGEIRRTEILENYYQLLITEGFEGSSISKIAKRMNINPRLIIHYFKIKDNMTDHLVDFLIQKYESLEFLQFDHIEDLSERFIAFINTIFSKNWFRTVNNP